jgi:hypothetical protein
MQPGRGTTHEHHRTEHHGQHVMPEDTVMHGERRARTQSHSPALAAATVGVAMGTGTDVAAESAGITLLKGDLIGIVRARTLSHAVMQDIRQHLFLSFAHNVAGTPLAAGVAVVRVDGPCRMDRTPVRTKRLSVGAGAKVRRPAYRETRICRMEIRRLTRPNDPSTINLAASKFLSVDPSRTLSFPIPF